jgi:chromate transport protein ChrA
MIVNKNTIVTTLPIAIVTVLDYTTIAEFQLTSSMISTVVTTVPSSLLLSLLVLFLLSRNNPDLAGMLHTVITVVVHIVLISSLYANTIHMYHHSSPTQISLCPLPVGAVLFPSPTSILSC